jgi:chromosome segregation ATPase
MDMIIEDANGGDINFAAIEVHPVIPVPPPVSPEEILRLQAQADESMRLQEALDVALQSVQDITSEKDAISNDKAETERILQETQLFLQTQTEENANLSQQQDVLNQRLQALTTERDAALNRNDDDSRLLSETRELLQTEIQLKEELAQQLDIATSRKLKVTLERDSAIVRGNSLEAQLGPLQARIKELQEAVDATPNLQQSLTRARLEAEQVPILQERLNHCAKQIKSLELRLSTKVQENKKLHQDFEAKRVSDIDAAKNACKVEAEKHLEDALSKEHQEFGEQVLQCLQNLSLPSDELQDAFSQACSEKYAEDCYLVDLFGILQLLIDHIYTNHGEQMVSVERELKDKVQELDCMNQSLSTQLNNAKLSTDHFKSKSDSLQIKLDATLQQLEEKENQVESLLTDSSELEKTLAQKIQRYDETVTELRSGMQEYCLENQNIARQLMEKEQELSTFTNDLTQSKQDFAVALDERNKLIKSHEQQIAINDVTISQLTANVRQQEESLRGTKADLNQKLARITELEFAYQQQQAISEDSRRQVLALTTQVQSKDTTIESLKERVLMLEDKSKTDAKELEKLTHHCETQLTQANARISDLNCQLNVLSNNSVTIQRKLDDVTKEKLSVATQLQVACLERYELQSQAQDKEISIKSLKEHIMMLEASLKEKDDETKKLGCEKHTLQVQLTQAQNNLFESTSLLVLREQTITKLTMELEKSASIFEEKDALVARFETALDTANQRLGMMEASIKEKDTEIAALKSLLDVRDVMMNLRGCAWYWWTTLPSSSIPLVTGLSI